MDTNTTGAEAASAQASAPEQAAPAAEAREGGEFTPITSQEQLDAIIGKRLAREREKFADYDELKEAAQRAARSNEELREQLKVLDEARQRREWVDKVASETGVPADVLRGSTLEELRDHAKALKALLPASPIVKGQGEYPTNPATTPEQRLARDLFGKR